MGKNRVEDYSSIQSKKAKGMNFGPKSNYDPKFHEPLRHARYQARMDAEATEKAALESASKEKAAAKDTEHKLHLTRPIFAEPFTINTTSSEWGDAHEPRGIAGIIKSFYDDYSESLEAVRTFYVQHKDDTITPAIKNEYQQLYDRAQDTFARASLVKDLSELVANSLSADALKASSADIARRIKETALGIDPKYVADLLAQDIRSLGGILKWLYGVRNVDRRQFALAVKIGAVLLFGTVIPMSLSACGVTVEPGVTVTATGEDPATDLPPTQEPTAVPTAVPTEPAPVATETAAPESTQIPTNIDVSYLESQGVSEDEINAIIISLIGDETTQTIGKLEASQANLIASESNFRVLDDSTIILGPGDYGDATYGEGDAVYINADNTYTIYSHIAWDGQSEYHLDESYILKIAPDGTPTWTSETEEKTFYFADWVLGGEFIPYEMYVQEVDLFEAQAFAEAGGLAPIDHLQYDDVNFEGQTVGYGVGDVPLITRQNESSDWETYVQAAPEWLFGPEEKVTYEFADMMEIPAGTMAIIQTDTGGWEYVPYNSQAVLNLLNLQSADQILAPGELNLQTQGVINSESFPAKMVDGIGTNSQLFRATPFVLRGSYRFVFPNKPDLTSVGFNGYSWTTDSAGNPLLIAEAISMKIEGLSDNTTRDYGSTLNPDGSIDFIRSGSFQPQLWKDAAGTPFSSFEDFINYVSQNPDNPIVGYLLGTVPDSSMTGLGQAHLKFDSGSFDTNKEVYNNTLQYPTISNAIPFAGFYLPEDFGNSEN